MSEPLYQEKYVAFIDMLGFSHLVRAASGNADKQATILAAIERLKDTACTNSNIDLIITYFSDCLVISSARSPLGLYEMLQSIRTIAENLLVVDVLIRGGLTVGEVHHNGQFMFGPGMLDAYDMERHEAKHPTVLVSEIVRSDTLQAGLRPFLIFDDEEPERAYVHYLMAFANYDPTPQPGLMILDGPARLIRHFIAQRLASHEGTVREKAEWLEKYWNGSVGTVGVLGVVNRLGDLTRPDAHPFRSIRAIVAGPRVVAEG